MATDSMEFTDNYREVLQVLSTRGILLGSYDTAGKPNLMTIGWATLGWVWSKPVWIVLVRPSRHSYSGIEKRGAFSLNVPERSMAEACEICGTKSGRDTDKFAACGLTAERAHRVDAPTVARCPIVYECRVVHSNDILAPRLADEIKAGSYRGGDFHRAYWGEIVEARVDRALLAGL
jgi:flavin reductase (DIM6/NTAB) family NADH-FMN oxidoreductase RutF